MDSPILFQFIQEARAFSTFLGTVDEYGPTELLLLAAHLSRMCANAYELPAIQISDICDSVSLSVVHASERQDIESKIASGLHLDLYHSVSPFDLDQAPKATVGQLSEDLFDIWSEIEIGLRTWERGDFDAKRLATWHWRFSFFSHWGFHAVDALAFVHKNLSSTPSKPASKSPIP